jgi:DNA-binding transcriptional ArsR family regulator
MTFPTGNDADPYKAIIHPERRRILREIAQRPMTQSEIVEVIGMHQSLVSRHLHCLRDSDLIVIAGKRGRSMEYAPNIEAIDSLLGQIMSMKPTAGARS